MGYKGKIMESLLNTVFNVMVTSWDVLIDSSIFILFGFFVAGLLKGFIPDNFIQRHLGGKKATGVFKASLFGIPIPLCSCGVIPAASGLRKQGASKGAVTSFMISTPETGVDSMAITYALLDPIMTVVRPVSAFFTALFTGVLVNFLDRDPLSSKSDLPEEGGGEDEGALTILPLGGDEAGCCCDSPHHDDHGDQTSLRWRDKFRNGMAFAFGELLNDIGPWLIFGILLAGIISVYISPQFIESYLGGGILSMFIMILLATPLYVCATASTPIAAALAFKGVSPGAALVFLLAGPATNMATITVVSKLLGKRVAAIYVGSIMVCSLLLGMGVNWIYTVLGLNISSWVQSAEHGGHGMLYTFSAMVLLWFVVKPWGVRLLDRLQGKAVAHGGCGCGHDH